MCELFGVTSSSKMELNELLLEFFSHGREHPNGWGMAFFYGNAVHWKSSRRLLTKAII